MKKLLALAVGCVASVSAVGAASADLIGVELSKPFMIYNSTGVTTYDRHSDVMSVNATLLAGQFNGVVVVLPVGSATVEMNFRVYSNGNLRGGVSGDDLKIEGSVDVDQDGIPEYTGTLLTAEIERFGAQEAGTSDEFDMVFEVTGGSMAGVFGKEIGMTLTVENSTFNGSFCYDWMGGAKGTFGNTDGEKCPKEPGDWKNCSDNWPVSKLTVGGVEYGRTSLRNMLGGRFPNGQSSYGDAGVALAKWIIAAKLSMLNGAVVDEEVVEAITLGDAFLAANPVGSVLDADQTDLAEALAEVMEDYIENADCNKGGHNCWNKGGKNKGGKKGKGGKDCYRYKGHKGWGGKGGHGGYGC